MDTIAKQWCVWLIGSSRQLLNIEFIGSIDDCVRFVDPRCYGYYAILPYEAPEVKMAGVE